jgi:hypothetical protein
MAVYTVKGAILHEQFENPEARIVGIGIDIEHAFNGTWKELALAKAKLTHNIQDTIWSISRHMLDTVRYQVDVHGHLTDEQKQETGMAQGPTLSPTYFNISMCPLLAELDDGTIGIKVGDTTILGVAWSDDLFFLTTEDKRQQTLDIINNAMKKYKKVTNNDKVYIIPMWQYRDSKPEQEGEEGKEEEERPGREPKTTGHDTIPEPQLHDRGGKNQNAQKEDIPGVLHQPQHRGRQRTNDNSMPERERRKQHKSPAHVPGRENEAQSSGRTMQGDNTRHNSSEPDTTPNDHTAGTHRVRKAKESPSEGGKKHARDQQKSVTTNNTDGTRMDTDRRGHHSNKTTIPRET